MSDDNYQDYIVTHDEELLKKLWAKWKAKPEDGGLDSHGMAQYAHSMGLYPPGYEEGQKHSITLLGLSDAGPEYLVWSIGLDRPDPTYLDQDREEADDDDDDFDDTVWGELFPEGLQRVEDRDRNE